MTSIYIRKLWIPFDRDVQYDGYQDRWDNYILCNVDKTIIIIIKDCHRCWLGLGPVYVSHVTARTPSSTMAL